MLSYGIVYYTVQGGSNYLTIVPIVIKSYGVVIQMKAAKQYFPAVVFIARCKSSAFDYIFVAFGEKRCRLGRCLILAWHIGKM